MRRISTDSSRSTASSAADNDAEDPGHPFRAKRRPSMDVGGVGGSCSETIVLIRAPIMPMLHACLSRKHEYSIFQCFKAPFRAEAQSYAGGDDGEGSVRRTLGIRLRRSSVGAFPPAGAEASVPGGGAPPAADGGDSPLILWQATDGSGNSISVDPEVTKWLRPHQRAGVQFLFDSLSGVRAVAPLPEPEARVPLTGCILADDMGLGKTLQSIAVMWTLLRQGFASGRPLVRRCLVVCPASLVKNWASEIAKWLAGRCKCTPVAETNKGKVASLMEGFRYDRESRVLIVGYETLRLHIDSLDRCPIDLVICDEAHRLKNDKARITSAISSLPARRRLLLSGTPIQNDLDEFYTLASVCVPQALGSSLFFRKNFTNAILRGQDADAAPAERRRADERLAALAELTNEFILRRTNALLSKLLPPKSTFIVFFALTGEQRALYKATIAALATRAEGDRRVVPVLSTIQTLTKLCNHPALVATPAGATVRSASAPPAAAASSSSKITFLLHLVAQCQVSREKIVVISNFTQVLDLVERMLRGRRVGVARLDGATSVKKRHEIVTRFNGGEGAGAAAVFLLSSKAGGCGINLVGANRLVMFDADWNPANDKQALARVWRDGQQRECFIYRLFCAGTIEEKILQRQMCKNSLSTLIVAGAPAAPAAPAAAEAAPAEAGSEAGPPAEILAPDCRLAPAEVKRLFRLKETESETHDLLNCARCGKRGGRSGGAPLRGGGRGEGVAAGGGGGCDGGSSGVEGDGGGRDGERMDGNHAGGSADGPAAADVPGSADGFSDPPPNTRPDEENLSTWRHVRDVSRVADGPSRAAFAAAAATFVLQLRVDPRGSDSSGG